MKEIRASAEGFVADGNITPVAVSRNQNAIQTAIYKLNPGNRNGGGGRLIIDDSGYSMVWGGFDLLTGITIEATGPMSTTLKQAAGSNRPMFVPHRWNGTAEDTPNAFRVRVKGMTIDCNHTQQGTTVKDATIVKDSTQVRSPTYQWSVNERLVGAGILPDTIVKELLPDVEGEHWATMSTPAQQTLSPAWIYCGVSIALCGIFASTNPFNKPAPGKDWGMDPTDAFEDLEIRNARDAGIIIVGRSGTVHRNILVHACMGVGLIGSFDTHYSDCQVGFASWGGICYDGSSCHTSNTKVFNSGQNVPGVGIKPNAGYGFKSPMTYSEWSSSEAQQCSGPSFDLSRSTGHALSAVVSSLPGYLSNEPQVGFDLDKAMLATIIGTHGGPGAAIRLTGGARGNKLLVTSQGPLLTTDSISTGNTVL